MYQRLKVEDSMLQQLQLLFDDLGEQTQVLDASSQRPLVVHHVVSQLTLVQSGVGCASLNGDVFPIVPGDLLLLKPGCEHAFLAQHGELALRHWHWPQAALAEDRTVLVEEHDFEAALGSALGET